MKNHDVTVVSCASCFGMSILEGRKELDGCPNCKSNNKALTRARYWMFGQPNMNENLIK